MAEDINKDAIISEINNYILEKDISNWREKVKAVLYSQNFCGLCLKKDSGIHNIESTVNTVQIGLSTTYANLMTALCREEKKKIFCSDFICEECAIMAIKSTTFTINVKKNNKILNAYLESLQEHVDTSICANYNKTQNLENLLICVDLKPIIQNEYKADTINMLLSKTTEDDKDEEKMQFHNNKKYLPNNKIKRLNNKNEKKFYTINKNYTTPWHCPECDELFLNFKKLKMHLNVSHNNNLEDIFFYCNLCDEVFYSKEEHNCKYSCPECEEGPCPHEEFLFTYREQKEAGYKFVKCLRCSSFFNKKINYIKHINDNHLNIDIKQHEPEFLTLINCKFCEEFFKTQDAFDKHISQCQVEHNYHTDANLHEHLESEEIFIQNLEPDTKLDCDSYDDLEESQLGDPLNSVPVIMENISEDFLKDFEEKTPSTNLENDNNKHQCDICGRCFPTYNNSSNNGLVRHRRIVHKVIELNQPYRCRYCKLTYKTQEKLVKHYKKRHRDENFEDIPNNLRYTCKCYVCNNWFTSLLLMTKHMKDTHKDYRYVLHSHTKKHLLSECTLLKTGELCITKELKYPKKITKEVKKKGRKRKEITGYNCEQCNYNSKTKNCLEAHINRFHKKERPYICDVCSKSFLSKWTLAGHLNSHFQNIYYQCEICGAKISTSSKLKVHVRHHTGERPYACDMCEKRFNSSSELITHKLSHTNPTIECPVCTRLFHSIRRLRDHFKVVHLKVKGNVDVSELPEKYWFIFEDQRSKIHDIKLQLKYNLQNLD